MWYFKPWSVEMVFHLNFLVRWVAGDWKSPTQPLDGRERRLARVKDSRLARAKIFRVKDSPGLGIVLPCAGPSIASVEHGLRRCITTDKNTARKKSGQSRESILNTSAFSLIDILWERGSRLAEPNLSTF